MREFNTIYSLAYVLYHLNRHNYIQLELEKAESEDDSDNGIIIIPQSSLINLFQKLKK
jgi:hypothetical protein